MHAILSIPMCDFNLIHITYSLLHLDVNSLNKYLALTHKTQLSHACALSCSAQNQFQHGFNVVIRGYKDERNEERTEIIFPILN